MKKSFFFSISLLGSLLLQAQNQQNELLASVGNQYITTTDYSGITIETQITVEKEGNYILITFWEETENGFLFKNINWSGNVELELASGKKIKLVDRKMQGQEMLRGGYIGGYYVPDLYQRYSTYFLNDSDCELLKNSKIVRVSYQLDDKSENKPRFMIFANHGFSLHDQLIAIGK